ncbi:ATP-NAD kinase [Nadsonia fulvescens var. elongata DSM 6958]|uniref:ATP-NAD kinase n=1 Tax=Nadsonia fulvescens var. elongata DSM 6958 TaxID=857566 RepID=A0A1E3PHH2_9ASCO|nr:ATP-NAD kinase [Nadsonia fulvescens var. elongata DSM 6958]
MSQPRPQESDKGFFERTNSKSDVSLNSNSEYTLANTHATLSQSSLSLKHSTSYSGSNSPVRYIPLRRQRSFPSRSRDPARRLSSICVVHEAVNIPSPIESDTASSDELAYSSETSITEPDSALSDNELTPSEISRMNDYALSDQSEQKPMTKEALSDMLSDVRALSKRLGNLNIRLGMKNIMIVTKIYDAELHGVTREFALYLLSERLFRKCQTKGITVYVQDVLKDSPEFGYDKIDPEEHDLSRLKFWSTDSFHEHNGHFDFIITLGGDGTVLFTSWLFQRIVPPVLSFGLGSLGFLTDFSYDNHEDILTDIIDNGATCSLRMRFECTLMRSIKSDTPEESRDLTAEIGAGKFHEREGFKTHAVSGVFHILNDVVIDRGPNPTITTTELYGDYDHLTSVEADGVVISTPSGSTAYSLSAGGSLVHPEIPSILISPICPHTLSFRPLILPDSVMIRVGVPYDSRMSAWCSFDGKSRVELSQGDFLTITASRFPLPKIQNGSTNVNWFTGLKSTLHWNERKRQKPFTAKNIDFRI